MWVQVPLATKDVIYMRNIKIKKYCENCNKLLKESYYGSGRFCNEKCKNSNANKDKKKLWERSYCKLVFNTRKDKYLHIQEKHPDKVRSNINKTWICKYCNNSFFLNVSKISRQ